MVKQTSLGPLEQQIMRHVWDAAGKEPVFVRQIFKLINKERQIAYTTVMTIMNRLEEKGLLKREKDGKAYLYTPQTSQQKTVKSLVHQTMQSLVNQFGHEAITAFADELQQLPEDELKKIIKELQKKPNNEKRVS